MSLSHWFFAACETVWEELPSFLGGMLVSRARSHVRATASRPWHPSVVRRVSRHLRSNSVSQGISSMPPAWTGARDVPRIIVFHDAHKAGPHLEVYLEIDGQCYNIGVKRLSGSKLALVRYNTDGELTHASKQNLLNLVRQEYEGKGRKGSWLGQSTDHRPDEARESWTDDDPHHSHGYGAGRSRTVLADDLVTIWKTGDTIEGRDWVLNPDQDFYVHRPFPDTMKIGFKKVSTPVLPPRLHLKPFLGTENWEKFHDRVGPSGTMTIKEDGASFYWEATPQGTRFWSPRQSKTTGRQIDYTAKLGTLRHVTSDEKLLGMGELTFVDKRDGRVLHAHEVGGILNSHAPTPSWAEPRLHLYRIDRVGRKDVSHEPYTDNLERIGHAIQHFDDIRFAEPVLVHNDTGLDQIQGKEGLVGIPAGQPLTQGYKFKPRGDFQDGRITSISFVRGDSGGIAGTVSYIDDHTGDNYNLSSGFTHAQKMDMATHPEDYIGQVMVIEHFPGHTARAGKFVAFHEGKGREIKHPHLWEQV